MKRIPIEKLMKKMPSAVIGDAEYIEKTLKKVYGSGEFSHQAYCMKIKVFRTLFIISVSAILISGLGLLSVSLNNNSVIKTDENGVYIERPETGIRSIAADMRFGEERGEKRTVNISVRAEKTAEEAENVSTVSGQPQESTDTLIRRLLSTVNNSSDGKRLYLPSRMEDGRYIEWSEHRDYSFMFIPFLALLLAVCVSKGKYDKLKKLETECRRSVEAELPDFLNRLVLLLNAGLVLSEAFEHICNSYERSDTSYFRQQLLLLQRNMSEMNSSVVREFRQFALRLREKELMRIANIMYDNVDKGTDLCDKLSVESEAMWKSRKKQAEEKGSLAETRMTFPLALMLLSLVAVTIAPALLNM